MKWIWESAPLECHVNWPDKGPKRVPSWRRSQSQNVVLRTSLFQFCVQVTYSCCGTRLYSSIESHMWGQTEASQQVNPASCLVKVVVEVKTTFRPDGGAGPKVREWLKSLGIILWGPRVSALNLMSICWAVVERRNKKLPLHMCEHCETFTRHSCSTRRCAVETRELVVCQTAAATIVLSVWVSQAVALTDGLRKTAHLDTNKEPPMI